MSDSFKTGTPSTASWACCSLCSDADQAKATPNARCIQQLRGGHLRSGSMSVRVMRLLRTVRVATLDSATAMLSGVSSPDNR